MLAQRHQRPGQRPEQVCRVTFRVHPTALIEDGVSIGEGTSVWDNVHIRGSATIGTRCIIGEKTYVAYGVAIGNQVKINAFVYICTGVTIDDGVMISASTTFTNDRFPRATTTDLSMLRDSRPDERTRATRVREGATIGAAAIIGNNITIGRFAMVGMGAVVTRSIPDFFLVVGNPARAVGCVCRCGEPLVRFPKGALPEGLETISCQACGLRYSFRGGAVYEFDTLD